MNSDEKDRIAAALAITQLSQSFQTDSDAASLRTLSLFNYSSDALAGSTFNKDGNNAVIKSEVCQLAQNNAQMVKTVPARLGPLPLVVLQQQIPTATNELVNMPAVLDTEVVENGNRNKKHKNVKRSADSMKQISKSKVLRKSCKELVQSNNSTDHSSAVNTLLTEPGHLNTQAPNQSWINVLQRPQLHALNAFSHSTAIHQPQMITSFGSSNMMLPHALRLVHPSFMSSSLQQSTVERQEAAVGLQHQRYLPTLFQLKIIPELSSNGKSEHSASLPTSPVPKDSAIKEADAQRPASVGCSSTSLLPTNEALKLPRSLDRRQCVQLPPKKRRVLDSDGSELRSESPLLHASSFTDQPQNANVDIDSKLTTKLDGSINSATAIKSECDEQDSTTPHKSTNAQLQQFEAVSQPDEDGDLPIHIAVVQGDIVLVKRILLIMRQLQLSINPINHLRQTPLHLAVITKRVELVQLLLDFGASVSIQNRKGHNCIHVAVLAGATDCLSTLTKALTDVAVLQALDFEGQSPSHLAVKSGNMAALEMLLSAGVDVDQVDGKSGRTALFLAIEANQLAMAQRLLQAGADVTIVNYAGVNPIDVANRRPYDGMVKLLEEFGADMVSKDKSVDLGSRSSSPILEKGKKKRNGRGRKAASASNEVVAAKPRKGTKVKVLGLESLPQPMAQAYLNHKDKTAANAEPTEGWNAGLAASSNDTLANRNNQELLAASMLTAFKNRMSTNNVNDAIRQTMLSLGFNPASLAQFSPATPAALGNESSKSSNSNVEQISNQTPSSSVLLPQGTSQGQCDDEASGKSSDNDDDDDNGTYLSSSSSPNVQIQTNV